MKRRLVTAGALLLALPAFTADHVETPTVTADPAGDMADVYLWRPDQAAGKIALGMTFAGRSAATAGGVRIDGPVMRCDRNILYVWNIDNNADGNLDTTPDIRVFARLARNANDQCGVRFENIPGTGGRVLVGREGQIITDSSGLRAFAGLVEDPFFFDTVGFGETLASFASDGPNGEIRIRNDRDGFAGRNISGIIFEMDLAAVTGGNPAANPVIQVWGETLRFPGTQP